jgi:endoglucanase
MPVAIRPVYFRICKEVTNGIRYHFVNCFMRMLACSSLSLCLFLLFSFSPGKPPENSWIRINLLGYKPGGVKVAIWCSKENKALKTFQLVEAASGRIVFTGTMGKAFESYGPFVQTFRLNFSAFKKRGIYYLQAGETRSPDFSIDENVYDGAADFCLRYLRQQRTGFNPYLKDSCHTHDGYVFMVNPQALKTVPTLM